MFSINAINKLLLREVGHDVVLDVVERFHQTSGGESPARTTFTLILNGGDSTLRSPINRGSDGGGGQREGLFFKIDGSIDFVLHEILEGEFFLGQISEFVGGGSVSELGVIVVGFNFLEVIHEN